MPIKIEENGVEKYIDATEPSEAIFLIKNNDINIDIKTPLKLDTAYKNKEFELHFLIKKGTKESDVFQIYARETDERIGWAIPTISLNSSLHDFSENPHFLRYAYIGIKESLKNLNDSYHSKTISSELSSINYSDIFHEETVLLIISKDKYTKDFKFNIDSAAPSLVKHGYTKLNKRNPEEAQNEESIKPTSRIYIEQISKQINSHLLISELLNTSFSYEKNPIFKFFYLYQIIELLIDDVYKNEQENLIEQILDAMGDSGKTKDSLDQMQHFMSEKKRLGLLATKYTNLNKNTNDLKILCNNLLSLLNREKSDNFNDYLYKIRNFIFHQYRDFPETANTLLNEITQELISIFPSMLHSFKNPKT